jgi:hypothetical protein
MIPTLEWFPTGVNFLSVFTATDVRRAHVALHPAR